jgi:hypothetical protein
MPQPFRAGLCLADGPPGLDASWGLLKKQPPGLKPRYVYTVRSRRFETRFRGLKSGATQRIETTGSPCPSTRESFQQQVKRRSSIWQRTAKAPELFWASTARLRPGTDTKPAKWRPAVLFRVLSQTPPHSSFSAQVLSGEAKQRRRVFYRRRSHLIAG